MLKKLRSLLQSELIKSSGVYTLTSIFEKAIPFLLLPVLTRYLTTEDYGIVSMFTVLIGMTIPFTGLGIKPAVLKTYYKKDIDFPSYVSNALFILTISTTFVLIVFNLFSDIISNYSGFPSDWLLAVVIVAVTQYVVKILLAIWQAQKNPIQYGVFKILVTALNLGISVFLIVGLGYGWEGRVIGKVIAYVSFGCLGLFIIWKKELIKFKITTQYIKHALNYGVPLIPHILSGILITYIDRIFITNMVNISETGIYTVGYQIGMIISVLAGSFNKAWTPWLFEKLNDGNSLIKRKIVKITYLYYAVIVFLALILAYLAPWFMGFFVGQEFYGATKFIIWIALGYAFNGMYFMVTCYIFYTEKTYILAILTFISAIINMILNYILITIFGSIGAAYATTLAYFFLFILSWIWASKIYEMPWLLQSKN